MRVDISDDGVVVRRMKDRCAVADADSTCSSATGKPIGLIWPISGVFGRDSPSWSPRTR